MSRYRSRTVTIDADVCISEFDDDVILEEAQKIIERHRTTIRPDAKWGHESWDECERFVSKIATTLGIVPVDDGNLPPPSSAATILTKEQLENFIKQHPERFLRAQS